MRFSRDYRFWYPVPYFAFTDAVGELLHLVAESHPSCTDYVLACHDHRSYAERVKSTLDQVESPDTRATYPSDGITRDVWINSQHIELFIKDPSVDKNFMITLSIDRRSAPHRLMFYAQCIPESLERHIRSVFAKPRFMYGIGDGYPPLPRRIMRFGRGDIAVAPID